MASSHNLLLGGSLEPWLHRSTFAPDSWFPSDTDSLYGALTTTTSTPLGSGSSDPDPDPTPSRKRSGSGTGPGAGPVSGWELKRKPRASEKNPTTYITADAANFRQMVKQVTGVKFSASAEGFVPPPVLKPEPQRAVGLLPTLDTSSFLFGWAAASSAPEMGCGGRAAGMGFDGFSCFPTLDSWNES